MASMPELILLNYHPALAEGDRKWSLEAAGDMLLRGPGRDGRLRRVVGLLQRREGDFQYRLCPAVLCLKEINY